VVRKRTQTPKIQPHGQTRSLNKDGRWGLAVQSEVVKEMIMPFYGLSSLGVKADCDLHFVSLFSTFLSFDSFCGQNFARRQM